MYLPSLFFGGSSIIHLLASHPRVVAVLGLGALMSSLLTPFGLSDVRGTAAHLERLDRAAVSRMSEGSDDATIERARTVAMARVQLPREQLQGIVDDTLRRCGHDCVGTSAQAVLSNPALLQDVLFLHELNQKGTVGAASSAPLRQGERNR